MMDESARDFFFQLLETPSPSGYERPVQELVRQYVAPFADDVRTDVHGNVIAAINPDASPRVMLAGHADQIGLLVQHIDEDGYVYVQPIGGWDPQVLIGQRLTVWGRNGPVTGLIARKPIHLLTEEERRQVPKIKDLWLDLGAKDKNDAEQAVGVGDPVTLDLVHRMVKNDRVISPGIDDKCGLWVVIEALRRAVKKRPPCAVFAVSTVQEEIGLRGAQTSAFGIDPHVGIAVDVTHATDCPTIDMKQEGDVRLGGGPVLYRGPNMNPRVVQRLIEAADDRQIPFQSAAISRATPTDANAMQLNRSGMATGLVSIANRYMHSPVEMISLTDIDHAAELLAQFVAGTTAADDFTP